MQFDPNQLEQTKVELKEGKYGFFVSHADDHESKEGKCSIKVLIKIEEKTFYIYLSPAAPWKIAEFLTSIGLADNFTKGEIIPQELIDKTGICELSLVDSPVYGLQLKVSKFYPKSNNEEAEEAVARALAASLQLEELNDDLPF